MKLFSRKAGNQTININGQNVKFVNGIAEVEDSFGEEALKLGLPDLFEKGKEPAYHTPREVKMTSDFKVKEEFYQKEIARLKNANEALKKKVGTLEADIEEWKKLCADLQSNGGQEANKNEAPNIAQDITPEPNPENANEAPESEAGEKGEEPSTTEFDEEQVRKEMSTLKKDELIAFAVENSIDITVVESKTKAEIIDFLIEQMK